MLPSKARYLLQIPTHLYASTASIVILYMQKKDRWRWSYRQRPMGVYNGIPRYVRRLLNLVLNKNMYHDIVKLLKWIYNSFIELFFLSDTIP